MAEKQCNLIKNGGGMSVRLRATITNSGSQTRAQVLNQAYTAIKSAVDDNLSNIVNMRLRVGFGTQGNVVVSNVFLLKAYNHSTNVFEFSEIIGQENGDGIFVNSLHITPNNSKYLYSYGAIGSAFSAVANASTNTDIQIIELYY